MTRYLSRLTLKGDTMTCQEIIANDLIQTVKFAMMDMRSVAIVTSDSWIKGKMKDVILDLSAKMGGWLPERMNEIDSNS